MTGEKITFLLTAADTGGDLLRMDMVVRPRGSAVAEHVHPTQEERFQVVSGRITLRAGDRQRCYTAGDIVTIPPGVPHAWWNSGTDDLRVTVDVRPAGRFGEFITTFFALTRAGKTDLRVPTSLLQMAVTFAEYRDVVHGTNPPWALQQVLFAVLGPLGRLFGYRPDEPYYLPASVS